MLREKWVAVSPGAEPADHHPGKQKESERGRNRTLVYSMTTSTNKLKVTRTQKVFSEGRTGVAHDNAFSQRHRPQMKVRVEHSIGGCPRARSPFAERPGLPEGSQHRVRGRGTTVEVRDNMKDTVNTNDGCAERALGSQVE